MVEAAPTSSLEVAEANFLFELVVVAFNAPTQLGDVNELIEGNIRLTRHKCQSRHPNVRRFLLGTA
jgi:hypothetical protein